MDFEKLYVLSLRACQFGVLWFNFTGLTKAIIDTALFQLYNTVQCCGGLLLCAFFFLIVETDFLLTLNAWIVPETNGAKLRANQIVKSTEQADKIVEKLFIKHFCELQLQKCWKSLSTCSLREWNIALKSTLHTIRPSHGLLYTNTAEKARHGIAQNIWTRPDILNITFIFRSVSFRKGLQQRTPVQSIEFTGTITDIHLVVLYIQQNAHNCLHEWAGKFRKSQVFMCAALSRPTEETAPTIIIWHTHTLLCMHTRTHMFRLYIPSLARLDNFLADYSMLFSFYFGQSLRKTVPLASPPPSHLARKGKKDPQHSNWVPTARREIMGCFGKIKSCMYVCLPEST